MIITIAERMVLIKESLVVILLLLSGQSRAMDGCKSFVAWRCGDQCIYKTTSCQCGDSTFGKDESQWCCTEEERGCEGKGEWDKRGREFWLGEKNKEGRKDKWGGVIKIGADCSAGQAQNLTQACQGVCNYFPGDFSRNAVADRSFRPCNVSDQSLKTTQCIREADWLDGNYDCKNRADEDPFHSGGYDLNHNLHDILVPCEDSGGNEGYKCSGSPDRSNCLFLYVWCRKSRPFHCDELNTTATSLSTDAVVCGNQTFWESKSC